MTVKYVRSLTFALMAVGTLMSQTYANLPPNIAQKLPEYHLSADDVSMWVAPVGSDTPLISHHAETLRTPASTQKLITTAIALQMLGKNFRWFTHVYHTGVVADGVLYGDVIIVGQGDPSLTHERLKALLSYLPAKGIRHIQGDIIVDNRAFFDVAKNPNAFDGHGQKAYNAQPNALLINYGVVEIDVLPSGRQIATGETDKLGKPVLGFLPSADDKVAVQILPPLADFNAPSTLTAQGGACDGEPNFRLADDGLQSAGVARSACGRVSYWLNFADGDAFMIKAIKGTWQQMDPAFTGKVRTPKPFEGRPKTLPLFSFPSRALSEQIYDINQHSNNVMTEQVALSLPLVMGHTVSTYPKAFMLIDGWWRAHLSSPAPIMSRASGLCRDCQVSVKAMGELLSYMTTQPDFEVFKRSLPIAGQTGTMAKLIYRNKDNPAIGRAFIKTGTLDNVTSMAGYVLDSQNRLYVAVGMINAPNAGSTGAVRVLDEMLATVATY